MSAVKNLRAMFEQKGDTSPPDRGRSPGIPHIGSTDSPRPLSKVRTSFIMVEKDGRVGLQREGSQDSIPSLRRTNGDSTVTTPTTATERSNPFDVVLRSPPTTNLRTQPILESTRTDSGSKPTTPPIPEAQDAKPAPVRSASNSPGPNVAAEKEVSPANIETSQPETGSASETGSGKEEQKPAEKEVKATKKGVTEKEATKKEATKNEATKPAKRTTKPAPKPLTGLSAGKAAAKPTKSPTAHKAPKTPPAASVHHPVKKTPEQKAQAPEKPATPRTSATSLKSTGPSSIKRPPPLQSSPANTGFVKPKVKSPTRPAKLPPGLTTHTTSSVGKVNAPRQSLSRASGAIHPVDSHARPSSRMSASTGGTASKSAATKGLKRQNSTIGRPRPSLGPPPKQPAKDHPPIKREREVDESFLARMMRPTHASASRTAEKAHTSPPRKLAASAMKKTAPVKHAKKATSKATSPAASRNPSPKADGAVETPKSTVADQRTVARDVLSAAEQSEEATKKAEGAASPQPSEVSNIGKGLEASPIPPVETAEAEPAVPAEEEVVDSHNEEAEAAVPETKSESPAEEAAEKKDDVSETTA